MHDSDDDEEEEKQIGHSKSKKEYSMNDIMNLDRLTLGKKQGI